MGQQYAQICQLHSGRIFEARAYPESAVALSYWGNSHLETLLQHYGKRTDDKEGRPKDALVDEDCC